jgi:hypothetical protein
MRMKLPAAALIAVLGVMLAGATRAQVSLYDQARLLAALSAQTPCCVIDGRAAANRQRERLDEALPYRPDLRIRPTANVVVIADRDQDALAIARALGRRHPGKPILAVQGGLATWRAVSLALVAAPDPNAAASGGRYSFVIPANTCEQGKPLQVLQPDKK